MKVSENLDVIPQSSTVPVPTHFWLMQPRAMLEIVAVILLLAIYSGFVGDTARRKSAYFDEPEHLISGYQALNQGDYRVGTANMILSQKAAALALRTREIYPIDPKILNSMFHRGEVNPFQLGQLFLYHSNNPFQNILLRGRLTILVWSLVAAVSVYCWSRQLFGPCGALVSLSLLATCPTFISLGGIIGPDMPAACLFLITVGMFWMLIHQISAPTICLFGVSAGLLLVTKGTSLAFGPVAAALLAVRIMDNRPLVVRLGRRTRWAVAGRPRILAGLALALLLATLIVMAVIWTAYGFQFSAAPANAIGKTPFNWQAANSQPGVVVESLCWAHSVRLLPEAFTIDLLKLMSITQERSSFLWGETGVSGWRHYFLVTLLAKSHPALIVCLMASIWRVGRAFRGHSLFAVYAKGRSLYDLAPVGVTIIVYLSIAMTASINIGHRHILPIYPFLFIMTGALGGLIKPPWRWTRIAVLGLLTSSLYSALAWHPYHLAYISPLFGGTARGHQLLVDSSLEWGQELPTVKHWLDEHAKDGNQPVYFSYFGSGDTESYGIRAIPLPSFFHRLPCLSPLRPGTYLISRTMLQPVYHSRGGTSFVGRWNDEYEGIYRNLRSQCENFFEAAAADGWDNSSQPKDWSPGLKDWMVEHRPKNIPAEQAEDYWTHLLRVYDMARFSRLTSFLRNRREPDAVIGHSVHVYKLDRQALRQALEDPPVELVSATRKRKR